MNLIAVTLFNLLYGGDSHAFVSLPPSRNSIGGPKNGYCPQCGNGAGICGDGNQWPGGSDYINAFSGSQATWTAGSVVKLQVTVTAHHKGHFEISLCDKVISSSLQDAQACLDKRILQRASAVEAGIVDCASGDKRGFCQPIDTRHPERFYLPPPGFTADGSNIHTLYVKLPSDFSCSTCTLQWRWWSANSCTPAPDYGCYAALLTAAGYTASDWGLNIFASSCPGGGCDRCGCGEEFRNCVDVTVLPGGGSAVTTTTSSPKRIPTSPLASTTSGNAVSTSAPGSNVTECISQSVLTCINGKTSYWPKCDPSQSKTVTGPSGYEYGFYCDKRWIDALNRMLSDPAVNKCHDKDAILKMLAQLAYETGYFSTVYQPLDGGAGLIHMIPANWQVNAADMDEIFPGGHYATIQKEMGKDFFQSSAYAFYSLAAWFKRTNRVISGCGLNLFDQSFDTQTRCIFGGYVDRSEAYNIVSSCMAQHATTSSTARATVPGPASTATRSTARQSTTTALKVTTTTQTTRQVTSLPLAIIGCIPTPGLQENNATSKDCERCAFGIPIWPCDTKPSLCTCFRNVTVSTTQPTTGQTCYPTAGLPPNGATREYCDQCAQGYKWWPCNTNPAICTCDSSKTILP